MRHSPGPWYRSGAHKEVLRNLQGVKIAQFAQGSTGGARGLFNGEARANAKLAVMAPRMFEFILRVSKESMDPLLAEAARELLLEAGNE